MYNFIVKISYISGGKERLSSSKKFKSTKNDVISLSKKWCYSNSVEYKDVVVVDKWETFKGLMKW